MTRLVRGENSAASDRPGPNLKQRVAVIDSFSKGNTVRPAIMLEKDRLHSYLYGPRAPPMERWFSTTTGYYSDQDAQRQGGVVGKAYTPNFRFPYARHQ
jgi:hypothetical protein